MNDPHQDFEAKLASMRPTKPSDDLLDRIAQRVSDGQPSAVKEQRSRIHRPFRIWLAVAGLAAAVLVATTVWLLTPSDEPSLAVPEPGTYRDSDAAPPKNNKITPPEFAHVAPPEIDDTLPTVGNYANAMRESPEAFDVLLQKHAETLLPPTRDLSLNQLMKETSS